MPGRRSSAGRDLIGATGSKVFHNMSLLAEAKLCLRLKGDTQRADRVLAEAAANGASEYALTRETWQLWSGLSMLLQGRVAEAQEHLSTCLRSMRKGDRLSSSRRLRSTSRRRNGGSASRTSRTPRRNSRWRRLDPRFSAPAADGPGRRALGRGQSRRHQVQPHVTLARDPRRALGPASGVGERECAPRLVLEEFGEPALTVDGSAVQPRLTKSVELLSVLLGAPERCALREELLGALFGGRNDAAGRSYLRQALYRLREVLPAGTGPGAGRRCLPPGRPRAGRGLGAARGRPRRPSGRQDGEIRLQTLSRALSSAERGPYLATVSGEWVAERRAH